MAVRELIWRDLEAVLVIDDTTLGPAVGGTRTYMYVSEAEMVTDARALARAMTLKCALAGLAAGGCKIAVRSPRGERAAVFEELGRRIQALGGEVRTAGDLGTTAADLRCMASQCEYVHQREGELAASAARGALRCMEACAAFTHRPLRRVAVQGVGVIGAAVARALRAAEIEVVLADIDRARADRVAAEIGADVVHPDAILSAGVDIVSPCARGGVLDGDAVTAMRAWGVVGAANNILAGRDVAKLLAARSIAFVPDVIASAGAAVDGVGETIMGLADRTDLIDALGAVAGEVLHRAERAGITTVEAAEQIAAARLSH